MRVRGLIVGVLVVFGVFLAGVVPAVGKNYGDVCGFAGPAAFCTGAGFSSPIGVAVDNSSNPSTKGEVYVADFGNGRVVRFDATGKELGLVAPSGGAVGFVNPMWDAVDPSNGDLYVSDYSAGTVSKFNPAGVLVAGFGTGGQITGLAFPAGVGVDPVDGRLFVTQRGNPVIAEYDSSGKALGSFPTATVSTPDSIVVDGEGNVFEVDERAKLVEYPASNRAKPVVLDTSAPFAVAIDPTTKHLYVDQNSGSGQEIAVYEPNGTFVSSFGLNDFSGAGSAGIAVNSTTNTLYASDIGSNLGLIFEEGEAPETPVTGAAGEGATKGTSMLMHGTLNPGGATGPMEYQFNYNTGVSCAGGASVPVPQAKVAEAKELPVQAQATGLSPRTKYKFCLVAISPFGRGTGAEQSYTTGPGTPVIEGQSSSELTVSSVKLSAVINPSGANTTCTVKYGPEESYGSEAPCPGGLGEGLSGQPTSIVLSGLRPDQTYHYRFFAKNEVGEGEGTDQTFKTLIAPPLITQPPTVSGVGRASVLLSGMVNPQNTVVFYHFIYGATSQYGSSTFVTEGGSGVVAELVSQQLEGLTPGTTYHYALVVSNPAGGETSVDGTFTTSQATPPLAITGAASGVTATNGTVSGSVQPNSLPTTYAFQIGTDTSYGGELPGIAGSGSETVGVSATFSNLQPATTYHYRLAATNQDGTSYGQDETFTTPGFSTALIAPVPPLQIGIPSVVSFPTETGPVSKPKSKKVKKHKRSKKKSKRKKK
jgi:DNA-binding beta-propeller fold protein YncE